MINEIIISSFISMLIGLILGYFLKWETRKQLKEGVDVKTLLSLMTRYPKDKEEIIWEK